MFSTKQFAWKSIKVFLFGRLVTELRGVEYTVKHEKEAVHGAGDEPLAIQPGNKTYEGNLTILQSGLEAMIKSLKALGFSDITELPGFEIHISYANPGEIPITDTLIGCEFTEEQKGMKQGDKFSEHTLPFIFLRKVSQA